MIYLDNAATTWKKPRQVIEAVMEAMETLGNSARGSHGCSLKASHTIYKAREKFAGMFGCQADHVVFTSNATEALNIAINGTIASGSHVITTDLEHNSVLRPLYRLEQEKGIELDFVQTDKKGQINYHSFEQLIKPNTQAIVCTHASNLTGDLTDLARVGEIARKNRLLFLVDASQTAGIFPVDIKDIGIDILCFTGHKGMMGPQGTGGMCIGQGVKIRPWKVGGTGIQSYSRKQPEQLPELLEAGTLNGHGIAGLSAAIDYILTVGPEQIRKKEQKLMWQFYDGISQIPGVTVYGNFEREQPEIRAERAAIVAFNIKDCDSGEISDILWQEYGIATRPGAHCAPRLHEALGTKNQGAVRASFSWFNTKEEVDEAIKAVRELAMD